jgi:serine/threonine protein kinase
MELVRGEPITAYCARRGLPIEHRLELFISICHGVQHAHQKGIIHRDLKPSNVLVSAADGAPTPKIIDFGIAKAMHQPIGGRAVTEARQMLGTPQYMSPEQADMDGQNIDTRSDIYSLGVVLYELLTGTTPLDAGAFQQVSYSQMQAMIRDGAVERPSTRVSRFRRAEDRDQRSDGRGQRADGANRGLTFDLRPLTAVGPVRRLRGDLDWITLKALEHDRDRRYSSVSEFADDVRRQLYHEPVRAGPPTVGYRV